MIGICYRDDGHGKGMFYDHYTIQHATKRATCSLKPSSHDAKLIYELLQNFSNPNQNINNNNNNMNNNNNRNVKYVATMIKPMNGKVVNYSEGIRKIMMDYLEKNENLTLKYHSENKRRHGLPMIRDFSLRLKEIDHEIGLLVVVGHLKIMENDPSMIFRFEFERNVIRKAMLIGQPVLCICSGSWRLWEFLGGSVSNINSDVQHASGMINLDSNGTIKHQQVGHGIILQHEANDIDLDIRIPECTILKSSMYGKSANEKIVDESHAISVNSIHWMAPQLPKNSPLENIVDISALSIPDYSIEAFETKFGVPIIGIQWHPEAYILNNEQEHQQNILKYMAKAGDAFLVKRRVLEQLLQTIQRK
ncbi:predicted protein [Naegleria gruberi]|uniref:Predicted protein n=1 Tax=Naegleria gruberi TaxID=5762 RepID=D2W1H4_NAEGR|nr:uncharacterized protein NAEGRDRAFT_75219 [Naegleria gruberi]EFC37090.1 predicted protein [Naegleria gruberi]|eukprot:XP_002669834.1 predicted protein [Naegleria gruberi strain NEG-M]